jgi:hypothetical protein
MILIILTIVVIALLIVALAVYLFMIGAVLGRVAGNLGDCLQSIRTIAGHAQAIGPGIKRINKAGEDLVAAMPLLLDGADGVLAKLTAPAAATSAPTTSTATRPSTGSADPVPATGVGYLDV